jgi:hypothetical protein
VLYYLWDAKQDIVTIFAVPPQLLEKEYGLFTIS